MANFCEYVRSEMHYERRRATEVGKKLEGLQSIAAIPNLQIELPNFRTDRRLYESWDYLQEDSPTYRLIAGFKY